MPDWGYPLVLVSAFASLGVAWSGRVVLHGAPGFDRIERGGSSILLGKHLQAMAYWALQPFGRMLVAWGVSANAVTWTSLVLGMAAGAALAVGSLGLGAFLGALSFLGDAVDGLVARLSNTGSDAGEVLDAAVDRYVEFAWLGGLALHYRGDILWLTVAILAFQGGWAVSYATAKAEALHVAAPRGAMRRVERCVYLCGGAAVTSLLQPWQARWTAMHLHPEWPMLAVLVLIAVVANASAVQRLRAVAQGLRAAGR
jgi:CDP-diacylglycerol--glycerol-3-phosphate 3-phosphatidyltransferase